MSKVLEVSKSGYYRWRKHKKSLDKKADDLSKKITTVFERSRSTYGSPRVSQELKKEGVEVSKSTVARQMKKLRITPKLKLKFKNTTDSKHNKEVSPNLLDRNFSVSELGKVWVSDITYIRVNYHHFAYLTTVIDLADRMVVGWALSDNMTDEHTTIAAFKKAVKNRPIQEGLIFHSDRGSQYASEDFRTLLKDYECIQSMSRKGNCWDNAVAESFFKTVKVESLYRYKFERIEQVYSVVFDYIEGWYNNKRIHSALGGKSPLEMFDFLRA
jgi:putative transposase